MHIFFSADKNYIIPLSTTIISIIENNKFENIFFHIANIGFDKEEKTALSEIVTKNGKEISFYDINPTIFNSLPSPHGYLSNATYIRLFISDFLPKSINKIIYLDCDTIINDSLSTLWNINLEGHPIAAVLDSYSFNIEHYNRLHIPMKNGYFNAGVMLINIDYWRQHNITKQCIDFANNYPERIAFEDQDIMNYVFNENKINLPLKYNAICTYFFKEKVVPFELWDELKEAQKHPVIIHFTWIKPWFYEGLDHPYAKEFFKYQSLTKWKGMPLKYYYKGWAKYKFIINTFLRRIGLKKKYSPYIDLQL